MTLQEQKARELTDTVIKYGTKEDIKNIPTWWEKWFY